MSLLTKTDIENDIYNRKVVAFLTAITCLFLFMAFKINIVFITLAIISMYILHSNIQLYNKTCSGNFIIIDDVILNISEDHVISCRSGSIMVGKDVIKFKPKEKVFLVVVDSVPVLIYDQKDFKLEKGLKEKLARIVEG